VGSAALAMSSASPARARHARRHDRSGWRAEATAVLAVAAGAVAFWRVYEPSALPVPIVVGTGLGAGLALLSTRAPRWMRLLLWVIGTFVAALLAGLVTAATSAKPSVALLSSAAFSGVRRSVIGGISRVLTTTLPAPATPDLLPQVAVLCAVGAALAVVLARRSGVLAFAPGGVILLTALIIGVGGSGSVFAVALPFAAVVAVGLLRRAGGVAIVAALAVAAAGVALGPASANAVGRHPYDPRDLQAAQVDLAQPANPLDLLPGWLLRPNGPLFRATVDQQWEAQTPNWRLATFDTFDGQSWTESAPAVSIGYEVRGPATTDSGATSHIRVTSDGLPGVYVPLPGPLRQVDRPTLAYDLTGVALLDPHGIAGQTYALSADIANYDVGTLRDASVASDASAQAALATPECTPKAVVSAAQVAVKGATRPVVQAQDIAQFLGTTGGFANDPKAPSGHSCGRIQQLFAGDHRGTAEQFATAFVLMARSVGLPTRLVVGFEPGARVGNTVVVDTGDATAWPEVDLAGVGWVPFDPTPRSGTVDTQDRAKSLAAVRKAGAPDPGQSGGAGGDQAPLPPAPVGQHGGGGGLPWWAVVLIAVGGVVLLLAPAGVVVAKTLRRRRRRRSGVLGAWAELLDRLSERGRLSTALTTREVHRILATSAPTADAHLVQLADLVDVLVYAPPAAVGDTSGDDAWSALAAAERSLRSVTGWRARVRHRLYPLLGTSR
jgi:transglutaminase-like putative cysteine protease